MQYTAPHYYSRFQCIAGRCPDTCCAGWQIAVDKKSLKNYKKRKDPFGNRLFNEIDWKEEIFRQYAGRCAFLNEDNLCDMYLEGGSKMLCRTCRTYPRHVEEFEGLKEISLSLSCPVAAHQILGLLEPVRFISKEAAHGREEEYEAFDYFLFTKLTDARDVVFHILQDRSIRIEVRMAMVLALAHDLQQRLDKNALFETDSLLDRYRQAGAAAWFGKRMAAYMVNNAKAEKEAGMLKRAFRILDGLEVLKDDWKPYLGKIKKTILGHDKSQDRNLRAKLLKNFDTAWEQLMIYFVYTYFCGAVYDGNAYVKMKFSLASTIIIREMAMSLWIQNKREEGDREGLFKDLAEAARRYAKEIEHSDRNKKLVQERLGSEELFGLETFFWML